MGLIANRLKKLKGKKEDHIINIIKVMKYFNWKMGDMKNLPIPTFNMLVNSINKIEKESQNKSK